MKNQTIELPVSELRHALPGLGKLIGRSRHSLPVLAAVKVARDNNGNVTLQGTDLDSTATFTLKDRSEGPATNILVPFERLQKAMKQSNGKVELSLNRKDEVVIRTYWRDTPMEDKMHVPYHDDWPKQPVVEGQPVNLGHQVRATMLEAMQCASEDSSRQVINSVYLDVEDKAAHYVVATNAHYNQMPTNVPYFGHHDAGGEYADGVFACDGRRYANIEAGHCGGFVVGWNTKRNKPNPQSMRSIRRYLSVRDRVQTMFEKLAQTSAVAASTL